MIRGNIQRFIPNLGNLNEEKLIRLPVSCLDYLLETYVFHWVTANIDDEFNNFIITGNDEIKEILRVDNSILWNLLDSQDLRHDYFPPWAKDPYFHCYYTLWKNYLSGKISLRLRENYEFAIFVSNFPDEFFKEIFFSELPFSRLVDTFEKIDKIIKRKNDLKDEFAIFYQSLLKARGESCQFSKDVNYRKISKDICKGLQSEISRLKEGR